MRNATWRKFWSLSRRERRLLPEALFWLSLARLALLAVPFRYIAPYLGRHMDETSQELDPRQASLARQIGWAVQVMAWRTPWESACLTQAMAAKVMLRRRHIASTLYLGVSKDAAGAFEAHAWVRSGAWVLTGGPGHHRFAVISTFAG